MKGRLLPIEDGRPRTEDRGPTNYGVIARERSDRGNLAIGAGLKSSNWLTPGVRLREHNSMVILPVPRA